MFLDDIGHIMCTAHIPTHFSTVKLTASSNAQYFSNFVVLRKLKVML